MSFHVFGAFGLEEGAQSFVLANPMAQVFGGEEPGSGSHGDALDPQVTPHYLATRFHHRSVRFQDDMQIEAMFAWVVAQIGRGGLPGEIGFIAPRKGETHLHPAADACQRCFALLQLHPIGAGIVADGAEFGLRAGCLLPLVDSGRNGLKSFGGFHASGDDQL